jgi:class 3 adenylate cyclase
MDDVRAVLDAVGSRRTAFFGVSEGAAMSMLFAATYPDRTAALVVRSASPRTMWAPDYPWGRSEEQFAADLEKALRVYGPRDQARQAVQVLGPFDAEVTDAVVDYFRRGASPGALEALHRMNRDIDIRHVLPALRVPTLVLHGALDQVVPIEAARQMTARIPGARFVEIADVGHLSFGPANRILDEIGSFLKGVWNAGGWEDTEPDRVLATIMFTDIVESTRKALELGDARWRQVLERHHVLVRGELARHRGREIDNAGDGFVASFDGPARAIRCARAIVDGVRTLDLQLRAGLHTGECEVVDGKLSGIAVHTGARVAAQASAGEVLVSSTVKDLVAGSGIGFEDRGVRSLKGLPGEWRLFAVAGTPMA